MSTTQDLFHLASDHHVHSTFSDGSGTLAQNARAAREAGLQHLGFVDHVRRDTPWIATYVASVDRLRARTGLSLTCGVEAKILDQKGRLDLPDDLSGVERIVAADHQMPGESGPLAPSDVRAALESGTLSARWIVDGLVTATEAAMLRHRGLVLAHLFSLLPKVGLSEDDVPDHQVGRLADAALRSGAKVEVSERWRCPSVRVARVFRNEGVEIVASSDAHSPSRIGRYAYVAYVFGALEADPVAGEAA